MREAQVMMQQASILREKQKAQHDQNVMAKRVQLDSMQGQNDALLAEAMREKQLQVEGAQIDRMAQAAGNLDPAYAPLVKSMPSAKDAANLYRDIAKEAQKAALKDPTTPKPTFTTKVEKVDGEWKHVTYKDGKQFSVSQGTAAAPAGSEEYIPTSSSDGGSAPKVPSHEMTAVTEALTKHFTKEAILGDKVDTEALAEAQALYRDARAAKMSYSDALKVAKGEMEIPKNTGPIDVNTMPISELMALPIEELDKLSPENLMIVRNRLSNGK